MFPALALAAGVFVISSCDILKSEAAATTAAPEARPGCALPLLPCHGRYELLNYAEKVIPGTVVDPSSLLVYSCDKFYDLPDSPYSVCEANNTWSSYPECKRRCKMVTSRTMTFKCFSPNSTLIPCQHLHHGSTVSSACHEGYIPPEYTPVMQCRDGTWSHSLPRCKPDCGLEKSFGTSHAVNAPIAKPDTFPWHVAIFQEAEDKHLENICGGSLLYGHLAISAAHCFYDSSRNAKMSATLYRVVAGKRNRQWSPELENNMPHVQTSLVKEILIPPQYTGDMHLQHSDISIIHLKKSFVFSDSVRPICLDLLDTDLNKFHLRNGSLGKVAGWGKTENGEVSDELRTLNLPVIDYQTCILEVTKYRFNQYLTLDKFCAGYLNGSAMCNGDSGGGLVFPVEDFRGRKRWYLRGIVSTGPINEEGACRPNTYTAFTNVFFLRDWIKDTLHSLDLL